MNLADARSYFSDGFAEACRDKTFVDEQIQAHADEPTYIRDAIRELGWYGELLNETKAKLGKEPGLAQRTALEYLWNHSAGPVSWGSLALWIRRQHPRGASRSIRAVEKLEDAGVISVKHRGWGGTSQPIVDVKLNSELLPAHRRPIGAGFSPLVELVGEPRPHGDGVKAVRRDVVEIELHGSTDDGWVDEQRDFAEEAFNAELLREV